MHQACLLFLSQQEGTSEAKPKKRLSLWQRLQNPSYMDYVSRWVLAVLFILFCAIFLAYAMIVLGGRSSTSSAAENLNT